METFGFESGEMSKNKSGKIPKVPRYRVDRPASNLFSFREPYVIGQKIDILEPEKLKFAKGSFFSESAMCLSNLQNKYSKSLS